MSVAALAPPADRKRTAALTLAALGVVFGDIGTSPLYTVKECFSEFTGLKPVPQDVLGILSLIKRGVRVLTAAGDDLTATDDPFKKAMRQIAGAFAELEKARLVAKLRHARERIRSERGKCEGRKTRIERAERENNPELVKTLTQALEMAKRLRRASPKTGERRSLRKISAELAAAGFHNERGQPFNPTSIKLMLEG